MLLLVVAVASCQQLVHCRGAWALRLLGVVAAAACVVVVAEELMHQLLLWWGVDD